MRISLALCLPTLLGVTTALADDPPRTYQLVSPKPLGILATGLNDRGDLVGFQWAEEADRPGIVAQVPIFARGKDVIHLPLLPGYTSTFPAAVSDAGLVVGRASKPSAFGAPVTLKNQAFLWDQDHGIRGLGVLPDDVASIGCGISRDGARVSGMSIGKDRIRACVWDRGGGWNGTPLPQEKPLGSNVVPISGDGRYVAAVDGLDPCLWSLGPAGTWTREVIGEAGSILPRAVNNAGTVAGLRNDPNGTTHAVVWSRVSGCQRLELPNGYVKAEATALNNQGVVVGMIDGPGGSEVGPNAFVSEQGRLRILSECEPNFTSATAINDRGQVAGVLEEDEKGPEAKTPAR